MSTILYLGLDVHKESVTIAVLPAAAPAPTRLERLPYDLTKLRRCFARLAQDGVELRACYEASGAGYVLQRAVTSWGYSCAIVASALIPTKPGERRKHDKKDAANLARLYRAGELTPIRIPTEAEERVREIVRCRETLQREILRSRHSLLKLLFRRGLVYHAGAHWTQRHRAWLAAQRRSGVLTGGDVVAFDEYLALLDYKLARRTELDRQIEALALTPAYQPVVARLTCFRGINTLGAMVLTTELGDWQRFAKPTQLMAYLGLVPSEHASGPHERRGAITKTGNSRCRHILVQAAWSARRPPSQSGPLTRRQRGQPSALSAQAWKAQRRLYTRFHRIAARRPAQVADRRHRAGAGGLPVGGDAGGRGGCVAPRSGLTEDLIDEPSSGLAPEARLENARPDYEVGLVPNPRPEKVLAPDESRFVPRRAAPQRDRRISERSSSKQPRGHATPGDASRCDPDT